MSDFISGLSAGLVSTFVCNPFDVIRTNMQVNRNYISNYKFSYLYRGIFHGIITIPFYWSFYFHFYGKFKKYNQTKLSFINGYLAANISSTLTCPLWFIRQKSLTNETFNFINHYKKYGIKPFYNGLSSTYIINLSFIIQMPLYENLKQNTKLNELIKNDTFKIFLITSFSKTLSLYLVYPVDTIRTIKRNDYNITYINIIKNLNKSPTMYFAGFGVYLIRSIPYQTTIFCTYEYLKKN